MIKDRGKVVFKRHYKSSTLHVVEALPFCFEVVQLLHRRIGFRRLSASVGVAPISFLLFLPLGFLLLQFRDLLLLRKAKKVLGSTKT